MSVLFDPKKIISQKNQGQNIFDPKMFWMQQNFSPNNFGLKNVAQTFLVKLFFDPKFVRTKHLLAKSRYLGQKKFCLKKLRPQKIVFQTLVKIGSSTAEIMLIWTIVAWTYMLPEQMPP